MIKTKNAFFYHTTHTSGISRVGFFDIGPRIKPVKTSCPVWTCCHTETATNAAVHVHHHDTIFALKGCLCRTNSHTGWTLTMVAKHQKRTMMQFFAVIFVSLIWKSVMKMRFPYPLNLVLFIWHVGHVMKFMTRVNTISASRMLSTYTRVNYQSPTPRLKRLIRLSFYRLGLYFPSGK